MRTVVNKYTRDDERVRLEVQWSAINEDANGQG